MSTKPQYSIIIPTYNRARFLLKTLDSVCKQTFPPEQYEIIIVDDGSTDDTEAQITNYKLSPYGGSPEGRQITKPEIYYFKIENGGPAKARNLGIKESKGEIIFFTDDDCMVPPDWMAILLDGYKRHPEVVGVGGWHKATSQKASFLERCEDAVDKKFGSSILNAEIKTNLYFFPFVGAQPANLSYKKSVLEECGGFDENLRSDKWIAKEFNIKVLTRGYLFLHLPLTVKRIKQFGLKDFFYKYASEGRDSFYLHKKYPKFIKDVYGNFLNNFLGLLAHFEISHFYIAYFFSTSFRLVGRTFAKRWERSKVKEAGLLSNENFEILLVRRNLDVGGKLAAGEKKSIQTIGRPFIKQAFMIKKPETAFYSVVIPTYNRAGSLIKALENLVSQTISPEKYEIIVVDDGSTDDTDFQVSRLCQGFGGQASFKLKVKSPEIRYFKIENGGPAKARNFGIKEAGGDIIFFTDDDCTVPSNWMEMLIAGFKKYPEAAGVGGWIWPPEGELEKSAVSRFLHFESFFKHPIVGSFIRNHEILSNDPLMCFGNFAYNTANVCYKKKVLQRIGGFRANFYWPGSEDNDLAFRITRTGHSLLYLPFHVIHSKVMTLSEFAKLHFHRGANGYLMRIMHQEFMEKLKPGSVKDYGSMASFISRFSEPEKFLALIQWLSINAGIRYMKRALKRNPVSSEPIAEIADDREKRKPHHI